MVQTDRIKQKRCLLTVIAVDFSDGIDHQVSSWNEVEFVLEKQSFLNAAQL
jgi:hypothetical protein